MGERETGREDGKAVYSKADYYYPFNGFFDRSPQQHRHFQRSTFGDVLAKLCRRMTWDIAFGRWLAFCVHPVSAWRARSRKARAVIVASYFTGAYLSVLSALALLN